MLARLPLSERFIQFNREWGAPEGSKLFRMTSKLPRGGRLIELFFKTFPMLRGVFGFQVNNSTRAFEYPWCFHASQLHAGMRAVDIGGSLAGFQFVLAKQGLEVINVDPGLGAHGRGWPVTQQSIGRLNRAFGTNVRLENCFLQDARIDAGTVDRVFSISVVEHIPETEISSLMERVWEILKPGGFFIATVDLFLNVIPFCTQLKNAYGTNISIMSLEHAAPFKLVTGTRSELYGYPEFSVDRCISQLDQLVIGSYPTLVQCFVMQKIG